MKCDECDGRGEVLDAPSDVLAGRPYYKPCDVCGGSGEKIDDEGLPPRLDDVVALTTIGAEELNRIETPIELHLRPLSALQLVGLLQLALRHPEAARSDAATTARVFIEHTRAYFRDHSADAVGEIIRRGDDPAFDIPFDRGESKA